MASESSSSLATSHKVDAVDESLGDKESSSSVAEGAPNAVVSLLSRLKSSRLSDFARKRKVVTNPPTGKRPCRGSTAAEPKTITTYQRVKEFPDEPLHASYRKLFCNSFHEQQDNSLQDYIESSLIYQYNKH